MRQLLKELDQERKKTKEVKNAAVARAESEREIREGIRRQKKEKRREKEKKREEEEASLSPLLDGFPSDISQTSLEKDKQSQFSNVNIDGDEKHEEDMS